MKDRALIKFHERFIKGTEEDSIVSAERAFICSLTLIVQHHAGFRKKDVYITARCLKHLYDKKPAEEYDAILANLKTIVLFPDKIFENKGGKRGSYCFTKGIGTQTYFASLEEVELARAGIYLATAFRVRNPNYLEGYKLIWSWEDGGSPS